MSRGLELAAVRARLRELFATPRVHVASDGTVSWWRSWTPGRDPGWEVATDVRVDPASGRIVVDHPRGARGPEWYRRHYARKSR